MSKKALAFASLGLMVAMLAAAWWIWTWLPRGEYSIVVKNTGPEVVDEVLVNGAGADWRFGPLEPGESAVYAFQTGPDGALSYSVTVGGSKVEGEIEHYLSGGMAGRAEVDISGRSEVSVSSEAWIVGRKE